MTQTNILELAKQGDAKAIAALMNRQLQPKGITAKATIKNCCLQIVLEAAQVPNQQALVAWVRKSIIGLGAESIERVKIYGRQTGEEFPAWSQEFELLAEPIFSLEEGLDYTQNSNSVIHTEQLHNRKADSLSGQNYTKPRIKTLSFGDRFSLAIISFITLFIGGIFLAFIPILGWILGPIVLVGAIAYPVALLSGDRNYISSLIGLCPYCRSEVTATMQEKSKHCEHCKSNILIRKDKFFAVEKY